MFWILACQAEKNIYSFSSFFLLRPSFSYFQPLNLITVNSVVFNIDEGMFVEVVDKEDIDMLEGDDSLIITIPQSLHTHSIARCFIEKF